MKQSSNHFKQTGKLTQYSSGEDDSGTDDIFTQKDLAFSDYLPRSLDLKQKRTLSSSLSNNRSRRTGMIDGPVFSVSSTRVLTNSNRRTSPRLISSSLLQNPARVIQPFSKSAVWHRSLVVRARLWNDGNCDSAGLERSRTIPDPSMLQEAQVFSESHEQVTSSGRNTEDAMFLFPQHGPHKKSVNCRKVLSDITKETVPDCRFQLSSYYSRDVLPLDAEVNSEADGLIGTKDKNENVYLKKGDCEYEELAANGLPASTRACIPVDMSKEFKTTEEKDWFSLHYQKVSMILVIIVLLFFSVLGLIYLNVRFKDVQKNPTDEHGVRYPVCDNNDNYQAQCIEDDQLLNVVSLLKSITPQLMARASDSLCNKSGNHVLMTMSDTDVLNYIHNKSKVNQEKAKILLKGVKLLVLSNPHWEVAVVDDHSVDDFDVESDGKGAINDRLLHHGRLISKNPLIPFNCQLKLWYRAFLTSISSPAAVCIAVAGVLIGLWDYKRRSEKYRQEVYSLVNKIIYMVRNHQRLVQTPGADSIPFISVEISQNEIIGALPSKRLTSAWEEAVKFIDVQESRIATEVHIVHGKPVKVWQWLCAAPQSSEMDSEFDKCMRRTQEDSDNSPAITSFTSSHSSSSWSTKCRRNRVWQGQAFETIAGSPNSLPCSPTPCLKIRHMFDPDLEHGDDWPVLIQDSILEKCEDVCILHLFIDCTSQEGCVFMKCSSSEEAGKAYRALHGWWFDTKLVTVKYLRTERYHERFPEAVNASSPLRPSNNQRLSMQELWHFPQES